MTNIDSDEDVYSTSDCTEDYKNFRNLEAMPNTSLVFGIASRLRKFTRNLLVC